MCGIIGILDIGTEDNSVSKRVINALSLLEYRGYDSIGITTIHDDEFVTRKTTKQAAHVREQERNNPALGHIGIGHTRWATHGAANETNCHPIIYAGNSYNGIAVVHNGIIENYRELKEWLIKEGYKFQTATDTETISVLMYHYKKIGLTCKKAVQEVVRHLKGSFAFVVIQQNKPNKLIGARKDSPLLAAHNNSSAFITSDANAISAYTSEIQYLPNNSIVHINSRPDSLKNSKLTLEFYDFNGNGLTPNTSQITEQNIANKGDYETFMLKEIFEQPQILQRIFNKILKDDNTLIPIAALKPDDFDTIHIIACGSSLYAGMTAKYAIEEMTNKVVVADIASEFCCRSTSLIRSKTLYILISQSGETADSIHALQRIQDNSGKTIGIVNIQTSYIGQNVDHCIPMQIDSEIAVAATKSFTAQLLLLLLLSCQIKAEDERKQRTIKSLKITLNENGQGYNLELQHNIEHVQSALKQIDSVKAVAITLAKAPYILFIGRSTAYPLALEGALKMKELAYIPSEGHAAGELKHGSIALIEKGTPVIVILPQDEYLKKSLSNVEEIKARGGKIIAITTSVIASEIEASGICDDIISVGKHNDSLNAKPTETRSGNHSYPCGLGDSLCYAVILQMLAYYTAKIRGSNIDKPRNLAKSVTVE